MKLLASFPPKGIVFMCSIPSGLFCIEEISMIKLSPCSNPLFSQQILTKCQVKNVDRDLVVALFFSP